MNNINKDSIINRLKTIKILLSKTKFNSIIDDKKSDSNTDTESYNSHDTRKILNKKTINFNNFLDCIGGNLIYIKSGTTGHTFKCITKSGMEIAIKVVPYIKKKNYGDIYETRRPENAEIVMIKLLSKLVKTHQTSHIVLPIASFYTDISLFIDKQVNDKNGKYKDFIKHYKKKHYDNKVSILISEWANSGDFLDFIKKKYEKFKPIHWKTFLFQIISTLAVIQSIYKKFRHNDFKANNILVHKTDFKNNDGSIKDFFIYIIGESEFIVPNIGYQLRIWDFDFACIPRRVDNTKIYSEWAMTINATPVINRYYDLHYFFNTLIKFFPTFLKSDLIPKETIEFVDRILPKKYRVGKHVHKKGRILIQDEYAIPEDVIKNDPYFAEFRKK